VISFGYLTDGLRGALMALVAIVLPPLLVLVVDGLHRRVEEHPAVQGFVRGLSLAVVGTFLIVLAGILRGSGLDAGSLLIALVSLGLGLTGRVPVALILVLAALAGIAIY
jgi:chromate transporter